MLAHVKNLPRDSAYVRSLQGERAYWDETTEVTATAVDAIRDLTRVTLLVSGNKADALVPYPRPGAIAPAPVEAVSLSVFGDLMRE